MTKLRLGYATLNSLFNKAKDTASEQIDDVQLETDMKHVKVARKLIGVTKDQDYEDFMAELKNYYTAAALRPKYSPPILPALKIEINEKSIQYISERLDALIYNLMEDRILLDEHFIKFGEKTFRTNEHFTKINAILVKHPEYQYILKKAHEQLGPREPAILIEPQTIRESFCTAEKKLAESRSCVRTSLDVDMQ